MFPCVSLRIPIDIRSNEFHKTHIHIYATTVKYENLLTDRT